VSCLPSKETVATRQIISSFGEGCKANFDNCLYRDGHENPASSFIIRNEQTGSRTIVNYNSLPEMNADELRLVVERFCRRMAGTGDESWWHFEGRIPKEALSCISHLRRDLPNAKISVEVEKPDREGLTELAAKGDVVFYSRTWAEVKGIFNKPIQQLIERWGESVSLSSIVLSQACEVIEKAIANNKHLEDRVVDIVMPRSVCEERHDQERM
jgi:ketohexokinase